MRNLLEHIWHLPRNVIVLMIEAYQRTLSPDHGPLKYLHPYGYCRHSPSCSQYAKGVVKQRGLLIGGLLALRQLITCTPWKKTTKERIMQISHMR